MVETAAYNRLTLTCLGLANLEGNNTLSSIVFEYLPSALLTCASNVVVCDLSDTATTVYDNMSTMKAVYSVGALCKWIYDNLGL